MALRIILLIAVALTLQAGIFAASSTRSLMGFAETEGERFRASETEKRKIQLANMVSVAENTIRSYYERSVDMEALKKEASAPLKRLVDATATQMMQHYDRNKIIVPEPSLRSDLLSMVRGIRYDGDNYFFICNAAGTLLAHPNPSLEGRTLYDMQDKNGVYLFREIIKTAQQKGEGSVSYVWPKNRDAKPTQKITWVRMLPELGWILGGRRNRTSAAGSHGSSGWFRAGKRRLLLDSRHLAAHGAQPPAPRTGRYRRFRRAG
jgi:methyl-accepting chemotaxis protein